MKCYIFGLVLFAVVSVAVTELEGGLRVRFSSGSAEDIGKTFLYDIPRNVSAAIAAGWTMKPRPEGPMSSLTLYCYEDLTFCVHYDDTEYIAGIQVAIDQSVPTDQALDWEIQGFKTWTVDGKNYWAIQQFYVDEEFLAKSKEDRIASRDIKKTIQLDKIWITGHDGERVAISTSETDIQNSIFTQQACYPTMGNHYFYNMSSTTECTSRGMYPWLLMYTEGKLVGTAMTTTGHYEVAAGQRDWFERASRAVVQTVFAPRGSECFYDYADNPGFLTMHIFVVDQPWLITCP